MNMEALPPYLRDLTLWARTAGSGAGKGACSCSPGPESALELLPSMALSSAQVSRTYRRTEHVGNTGHFTC